MKQKEFFLGVTAMLPLLLGVVPFGLVFGVLGISSGLTETETILMSVSYTHLTLPTTPYV